MKKSDLIPLKVVAEEVGMSRVSLWRAARSDIPGFPAPVVIRRLVFWKRADLDRLEEALLRYQGRVSFERQRQAQYKIQRLRKAKPSKRGRAIARASVPQPDLFDGRT